MPTLFEYNFDHNKFFDHEEFFTFQKLACIVSFIYQPICFSSGFFSGILTMRKFYSNSKQNDQARGMVADDEGNVYITGISTGVSNKSDYVTIKDNTSGIEQWVARYNGFDGNDEAQAIAIDKSGNIYVTGYSEKSIGSYDFATVKYNNAGTQQWVTSFNGPGNGLDWAHAIKLDKDGNVYVCGFATV